MKLKFTRTLLWLLICTMMAVTAFAEEEEAMRMAVSDGTYEVIFELNETPAAKSLFDQLPMELEVENYGGNEKIFYPPEALNGTDAVEGGGEAGGLAYFSPWGNVVMYYGPFGAYPGLYILGQAISGAEWIGQLSGNISVQAMTE